jgi:hypothetical protein
MRYDAGMTNRFCLYAATGFLFFGATLQATLADGRADWQGYAWQKIEISKCAVMDAVIACPLYHQKWDWKRNQWVDITLALDLASGQATLAQRLTNKDPSDQDYVCVTALVVDAAGNNLVAHHQNWQISHGEVLEKAFAYASNSLSGAATIHIGSKQCREGARQDDALYRRVQAAIGR